MKRIIPSTDGRLIEIEEGALRRPPKKYNSGNKKKKRRKPAKVQPHMLMPGMASWLNRRLHGTRNPETSHAPLGIANGLTMAKTTRLVEKARAQARKDMEQIKKKIDLSEVAEQALLEVITVMRGPHPQTKLQAAKTLLDFTMAKPVAKSEVTVNAAEKWLEELTADDDEG